MQYWTADRIMRLIIGLAIAAGVIYALNYLSDALLPFFAACMIAYLLQPLVETNRRLLHTRGRTLASLAALTEVAAVVFGVGYFFMPKIAGEFAQLSAIVHSLATGQADVPQEYSTLLNYIHDYTQSDNLRQLLYGNHLATILSRGSSLLGQSLGAIFRALGWALTLIYVVFILIYYPQIVRGFKLIIPAAYREQGMVVVRDVARRMNSYFRGQGKVALCAMVLYCVGFSIIRLPLAIPMGILVGVLYMIPYFQYVTLIPVAAICLIYSLGGQASFIHLFGCSLIVYAATQAICDYLITPHIMGKEMGLNPAMILLALSVWGSLLGILGMIIALPATSLILTYYERYISSPPQKKSRLKVYTIYL